MHDDEYDEEPEPQRRPRDPALDKAIARLQDFFQDQPQRLFYSTQIETSLERDFFHWITGKALLELSDAKRVHRIQGVVQNKTINFYANLKHRYFRRQHTEMLQLLARIFDPEFTHAVGHHGELMFDAALGRQGFRAEAHTTRAWEGRTWEETGHNLDRIITRDSLAYGVEIKNTQNYISREELRIKIKLCHHLAVAPLFIMRFAPKSYIHEVYKAGGFVLLFEEQLYPMGHTTLLNEVREKLGLKVSCPRDIKEGDIQRLVNWHEKRQRRN